MKIERRIHIEADRDRLWTLLTETDEIKRWIPELVSDDPISEGPTRVGTTSTMRLREGKRVVDYHSEITAFTPREDLEITLSGGTLGRSPMQVRYRLADAGPATVLEYRSEWRPRELTMKLLLPLIALMGRKHLRATLQRLKDVAEASR